MNTPSPIRTVLIDGHALCYRAFFAVQSLKNSKGQPTNAVFGFLSILRKIRKDLSPTHMAVCFDVSKKTNRHAKYAEYKIQRPSMPEDLSAQIPRIKELVRAYNIPIFEKEGIEADDVIATLAVRLKGPGREVIIASDDKDMYQLVGDGIKIFNSRRDALLGPTETRERFGVGPERIVDYLALTGDASDNIPGVDGIGEVTAKSLLSQYDGLDEILKNVENLKGKLKDKVERGRESALLSRELATLDTNVEVECGLETIKVVAPDAEKLTELFRELEFRSFADELPAGTPAAESRMPRVNRAAAASSETASEAPSSPVIPVEPAVKIDGHDISDDVMALVREARASGTVAIVPCFGSEDLFSSASFYAFGGTKVYRFAVEELVALKDVLISEKVWKVVYDAKAFLKFLHRVDLDISAEVFDVLLAGYLLRSGRSAFSLEALAWAYLNTPLTEVSREAQEAVLLARLREPLERALHEENLSELYSRIELPLSAVLADMELAGVRIDDKLLAGLSGKAEQAIAEMTGKLHTLAGGEFNLNSPKQLAHILFEKLQLPSAKRTKTGFSTDEEVLTKLSSRHELPRLILEYRGIAKLKSTYIDALPRMIDPVSGRVHCSFDQTGAETGRLSSNHPNLQNIPVRTELGREIRKAFIPSEGNVLLSADYSQIELRVLAHIADEPNLKRAFEAGEDIHRYTAALMFDVPQDKVTAEMRYNAKRINFGIVYGMSAFGLAKDLAVSNKEAQAFIDTYFARYPGIRDFMDREISKAREQGFVETMFGRRRYIPEITSRNPAVRQFAERQAINTPVQGAAADLIKAAMVQLSAALAEQRSPSKMIITVHDELVLDVPQDDMKDTANMVKRVMETAVRLSVPLVVTVKAGKNWVEMEAV